MILGAVLLVCLLGFAPRVDAQVATDSTKPVEVVWTDSDTKLANHYIRLLQKDPQYGKVLDLLWDLYAKKDQTPLLLQYFEGAASAPIPQLLYAHLLRKDEQLDKAREVYDRVLDSEPESVPALKALAEISDANQRSAKALSLYTRLTKLVPAAEDDGVAIRLRKAALHRELEQNSEAVDALKEVLAARPQDVEIRTEIVSVLLEAGETETAIQVLQQLAESEDPRQKLDALAELNRIYEFIEDFDGANLAAAEAMTVLHFKDHRHGQFFEGRVRLHERFDRLRELEAALESEIDPENPSEAGLYLLAEFYRLTADPVKEQEVLGRLLEVLPKFAEYRVRLAEVQMSNDDYESAGETLDFLLGGDEEVPLNLHLLRAQIELNQGLRKQAGQRLSDYLETRSGDADARGRVIDFARTNYMDGLVEGLLRRSADASMTASDGDSAPLRLAKFFQERGRLQQAKDTLETYITAAGDAQTVRRQRLGQVALAYRDLGLGDDALRTID
ncbi:MAG: tetratricopeptide repeat protein, partial [Verrucomicrobiota bacterium]